MRLRFFAVMAADVVRSLAAEHFADAFGSARRARRSASLIGQLYVNFGTPSSPRTLDRLVLKYVFHIGGGAGT